MTDNPTAQLRRFAWIGSPEGDIESGGPRLETGEFREITYDFIDDLLGFLREQPDLASWYREPVDLLEVVRNELMLQLRTAIRDWVTWHRLYSLQQPVLIDAPPSASGTIRQDLERMTPPFEVALSHTTPRRAGNRRSIQAAVRFRIRRMLDLAESNWLPRSRFPQNQPDRLRALFVDQYANNVHILLPVWQHLTKRRDWQCLYIAGREKVRRELARSQVPSLNLLRCEPCIALRTLDAPHWKTLIRRYFAEREKKSGMPTPPSVEAAFRAATASLSYVKLNALRLERAFLQFRPNVVFVSSGGHSQARSAELLARRHDCVSIHLQHGLYKAEKETRSLQSGELCLWGDFHRKQILRYGTSSTIHVTGSPKHDALLKKYSHLSQVASSSMVVFYSTRRASSLVSSEHFDQHLAALYAAARELSGVEFVVKSHPSETRDVLDHLQGDPQRPTNVRITHTDDSYALLQQCTIAMTVSSTMGYEALLFRKPLLILNLTAQPDELDLPAHCPVTRVTTATELAAPLRRMIAERNAVPTVEPDEFWRNDGGALERVLKIVEDRLEVRAERHPLRQQK